MREVLRRLEAGEDLNKFSPHDKRILKDCFDAGYFEGTVPIEMISERIVFENRFTPRLTYAGLQFLESVESSAENLKESSADDDQQTNQKFKDPFDIIKTIIKKSWALFCALGVIVTVFGWPLITKVFSFLLSLCHP